MAKEQMNWLANMRKTLARVMAALSPSCRQASRLQSEALDFNLPFLQRVGLRIHLLLCKWCRRYGEQIRFLREAAQFVPLALRPVPSLAHAFEPARTPPTESRR